MSFKTLTASSKTLRTSDRFELVALSSLNVADVVLAITLASVVFPELESQQPISTGLHKRPACAGRPVQKNGPESIVINEISKELSGPEKMTLTNDVL